MVLDIINNHKHYGDRSGQLFRSENLFQNLISYPGDFKCSVVFKSDEAKHLFLPRPS